MVVAVPFLALACLAVSSGHAQFVARQERWPVRGPWLWALPRELPQLYREFNGIDFGHAHLGETLLHTQDPAQVERARQDVLDFIFSAPDVPPDEEAVAPTLTHMVWEIQRSFNHTHTLHRTLYDVLAADEVPDKDTAIAKVVADYLSRPEAITSHPLDHHGRLWSWPESKAFRDKFPQFNTQIWAYHWLQAAAYDVQLMGDAARQRELMPRAIAHYHGYLKNPPVEWRVMPMMAEAAPRFSRQYPQVANIFDNLHMLHDNLDDVLCRPDLYPTHRARRAQLLIILDIYLHRNHVGRDHYADYHAPAGAHDEHGMAAMPAMGPRPPSVAEVLTPETPGQHAEPHDMQPQGSPPSHHHQ